MSARCLLIRDGIESAARSTAVALEEAGIECEVISLRDLERARPSEAVLLHIPNSDPVFVIWDLHRRGHSTIVALSEMPSSKECIEILNSGADFYIDAWAPLGELVARVRVALRRTIRMRSSSRHEIERNSLPSSIGW